MPHFKTAAVLLVLLAGVSLAAQAQPMQAIEATTPPQIDGQASEACWEAATWYPIDQLWLGNAFTPDDFTGQMKITWTPDSLYLLVEITDDSLSDDHPEPTVDYWKDDCLEVFIDEDRSGGNHQNNYNAFAYHISLSYDVVDLGLNSPQLFNSHVHARRTRQGPHNYLWELAIALFADDFTYGSTNYPVTLFANKVLGFTVAYCDNDETTERENFIGSAPFPGSDTFWQNADEFQPLTLVSQTTAIRQTPAAETHPLSLTGNGTSAAYLRYPGPQSGSYQLVVYNSLGQPVYRTQGQKGPAALQLALPGAISAHGWYVAHLQLNRHTYTCAFIR